MCAHVYVVCIQVRVCDVCTWVCGKFMYPGTCVCMCVCVVGTQVHVVCTCGGCMYSCMCIVCACVCVVCIQVPVCVLCTHGCVCLCTCMYVCVVCTQMHVCMHVGGMYVYSGCTQMHVACWGACTQCRGRCPRVCVPLYQSLPLSTLFPQVGLSLDLQLSEQPAHPALLLPLPTPTPTQHCYYCPV